MAKPGTKNLVTASMKPTSATTVGRCSLSCICRHQATIHPPQEAVLIMCDPHTMAAQQALREAAWEHGTGSKQQQSIHCCKQVYSLHNKLLSDCISNAVDKLKTSLACLVITRSGLYAEVTQDKRTWNMLHLMLPDKPSLARVALRAAGNVGQSLSIAPSAWLERAGL